MSLALVIGGVILAAMGVAVIWQRNAKSHYRSLFQAEAARLQAERRYRITLMSVGDAVISTDTEGRVEVLNPVAEALTGWGQEEARGKPLEEVFHIVNENTRRVVENPVRRVIREGIIVGLANHTALIARDKSERPIADAAAPIRDENGAITGTVLVFRDQTQEREVQRKLREGKARLDLALQSAEMGAWCWDVAAQKRQFDEQSSRLLGLDPKTFGGTQEEFFERVHPEDLETVKGALARTLENDVLYETDYRVMWPDGSAHHISSRARLERDDLGRAAKVNGVLWEVTDQKELEAQLLQAQKMEAVGQLAGGIAHDFNNILAAMLLHLQLLQLNADLTPEVRADLKELEAGTQRATSLTRQLLVFSRRQVMQSKRLDLNQLLGELSKMLKRLLGEQISLAFTPAAEAACVEADPGMLEQVVVNLCVNARDAMPKGGPLGIKTELVQFTGEAVGRNASRRAGRFVRLTVADAGCGMDEATLKRAFEPFFTTKAPGKGTGLGLATVYGIIKQHRGWVEVRSAPGRGSTFSVFLPAVMGDEEKTSAATPINLRPGNELILLVEDDDSVRKLVRNSLKLQGYQIIEAGDGDEAMRKWEECGGAPNLLLSDMIMPGGITGIDLARRLRQRKPGLRVIISSGYSAELLNRDERGTGHIHFLPKPYDLRTLAAAVRRCLDSRG